MLSSVKNYHNPIKLWLSSIIFLIFSMIVVGGLTRLTDSGLSITEWELFSGILPPFTQNSWISYFELYKKTPQYKFVFSDMSLDEFKIIFYWEYAHRLLGRVIGLVYLLPLVYFTYKKVLNKTSLFILYTIFTLIIFQGLLGWYMVTSGLVNDVTVSHYRLSLHLLFAFLILSMLFWCFLNQSTKTNKSFFNFKAMLLKLFFLVILLQIIIGAFVSGLDAGLIYQTWPKMNSSFFPDDINLNNFNFFISLNEQSFVQFLHRNLAYIILIFSVFVGFDIYLNKNKKGLKIFMLVTGILLTQISLGIFTLISGLNITLASLHQITSVLLVFSVLYLNHKFS